MPSLSLHSPLGPLTLTEQDGLIVSLGWGWRREQEETGLLGLARAQLGEYFDGTRTEFALPLAPGGSAFQRGVWREMSAIPHGEVRSYGALARTLATAPRAVGMACGRNPIPILIPCHRVVGADGRLTGYSGGDGLASKQFLLDLEQAPGAATRRAS
ncbi:MAG: methylated-DNA--[protein]-cysteine S-methyltransferase [Alphaproteobacteria bacterium]